MFNFFKSRSRDETVDDNMKQVCENEINYQTHKRESREKQIKDLLKEADGIIADVTKDIITDVTMRNKNILEQVNEHKNDDFNPDLSIEKFKYGDILTINENQLNPNIDLQNPHIGNSVLQIPIPTIVGFEVIENQDIEKTLSYDTRYFIDYSSYYSSMLCYSLFEQGDHDSIGEKYINALREIKERLIAICGSYKLLEEELRKGGLYNRYYDGIIKSRKISFISGIFPSTLNIKTTYGKDYKIFYHSYNEAELLATLNHVWRTGKL